MKLLRRRRLVEGIVVGIMEYDCKPRGFKNGGWGISIFHPSLGALKLHSPRSTNLKFCSFLQNMAEGSVKIAVSQT